MSASLLHHIPVPDVAARGGFVLPPAGTSGLVPHRDHAMTAAAEGSRRQRNSLTKRAAMSHRNPRRLGRVRALVVRLVAATFPQPQRDKEAAMQLIDHILAATIATERRREAERVAAWMRGTRGRGVARMPRFWAVLALVAATALVAAAQASALAPTTTVEQRHIKLPYGDCGSFTLIFEADVTRRVTDVL